VKRRRCYLGQHEYERPLACTSQGWVGYPACETPSPGEIALSPGAAMIISAAIVAGLGIVLG
jgi:hypothetical protein